MLSAIKTSTCCKMRVEKEKVKFYLHRNAGDSKKFISPNELSINPEQPIKILIHGWMDDKKSYWYEPAVQAYLERGNANIITVNWGKYAKGLFPTAVKAVKYVGEYIADMVIDLADRYGLLFQNIHLIGHSLGAHIAGYAGKKVFSTRETKLGRITGLDPAGPSFTGNSPDDRLCSTDADFVDIIHTDGGVLGYEKSMGHVDFYPNGGKRKQNGCTSMDMACSHKRAPLYFAESVNSYDFVGVNAPNYSEFDCGRYADSLRAVMGENVDPNVRGDFYLHTNKESPFARGSI